MELLKEKKAQGTIEYIAIIGGAIAVALIIGAALKAMANSYAERGSQLSEHASQQ